MKHEFVMILQGGSLGHIHKDFSVLFAKPKNILLSFRDGLNINI